MKNLIYKIVNKNLQLRKVPFVDMHMHTNWTDGENSSKEMFEESVQRQMDVIFFSEHSRKSSNGWFQNFKNEVNNLKKKGLCQIFSGTEVKILNFNGDLDLNKNIENISDFIMSSVHRFPGEIGDIKNKNKNYNMEEAINIEYSLMMSAIENTKTLILGHPFGMCIKRFGYMPDKKYFIDIINKCKKYDKVFEINANYHPNSDFLITECLKKDVLISLGSNAHKINDIGKITDLVKKYFEKH